MASPRHPGTPGSSWFAAAAAGLLAFIVREVVGKVYLDLLLLWRSRSAVVQAAFAKRPIRSCPDAEIRV